MTYKTVGEEMMAKRLPEPIFYESMKDRVLREMREYVSRKVDFVRPFKIDVYKNGIKK